MLAAADGGKCPECTKDGDCGNQTVKLPSLCVAGTCRNAPGDGSAGAMCWGDKQCGFGACFGAAPCPCDAVCIQDSPGTCAAPSGDAGKD